ncbi:hypothetical protein X801_09964, partial [Opisthorchis viverrini]
YLSREQLESLVRRLQDEVTDLRGRLAESEERNRILQFALPQAIRECLTNTRFLCSPKSRFESSCLRYPDSLRFIAVLDAIRMNPCRCTKFASECVYLCLHRLQDAILAETPQSLQTAIKVLLRTLQEDDFFSEGSILRGVASTVHMESLRPLLSPALLNPPASITVDAVSDNPSVQPVRPTRSIAVQNDLSIDGAALMTNQQQCRGGSIADAPLRPVLQELAHQVNSRESDSTAGTRLSGGLISLVRISRTLENIKRSSHRMVERPRRRRPNLTRPAKRTYRGPRVGTRQAPWTEHNSDIALRPTTHPFIKTTASALVPTAASPPQLSSIQPGLTITSAVSTFPTQTLPKLSFYTDSHEPETSSPGECLLLGVEHHSRVQADTGTPWNTRVPENDLQQQACDPTQQQQTNSNTDQNWLNLQDEFPGEIDWTEYGRTKREIGENPNILLGRPWSMYKASSEWTRATCALMSALFDPEQLSTSTVLGRGSSERRNRLPFDKVNYIVGTITQEFGVSPAKVRARMAQKCKDERRRVRMTTQTMGPDAV